MSLETNAVEDESEEFVDELKPGTKLMLGQYTIDDFLAAGGFGITYLAKDSLERRVVIKECFPGSFCRRQNHSVTPRSRAHQNELKSIVRMFSQEAMSLAKANHPNIVGVHQVFEENNTAYMALDYVHGRDLLEILQEEPESLKPELVESYLVKILDAVKHIHGMGMLHRDISPDNIIINEQGEPILIDFGAARESKNERVTRMLSALRVVKDGYSPQEFYIAGSDQTPSCDLYSLAASFYHLITGELPPDSQLRLSSCASGDEDPYVSLGEKTKDYSKSFVTALDKAMSILPRDRMQSADEWLAHLSGEAAPAVKDTAKKVAATASNDDKKSFMPILLGSTAVAAAAGVGFFLMSGSETPESTTGGEQTAVATEAPSTPTVAPTPSAPTEEAAAPEVEDTTPSFLEPAPAATETETASAETAPEPAVVDTPTPPSVADAAELPAAPVAEDTATPEVPPIVLALPDEVVKPEPRPTRPVEDVVAAGESVVPELDAVAPEAPVAPEASDAIASAPAADAPVVQVPAVEVPVAQVPADTAPVLEADVVEAPVFTPSETPAEDAPVVAESTPSQQDPASLSSSESLDFFRSMSNSEPALVSAPSAPRATAPASQATPAPAAPAPEPVATAPATPDVPSIVTRYVPVMPFTLSPWQPGVVISVPDGGPSWLTANARILSVNGQPVATNEEIQTAMMAAVPQDSAGTAEVTIGFDTGLNTAVSERALSVTTEQHTLLLNGLQLVSRETGGTWVTQVSDAPAASNFKVGDTLVSYVSTWEDLNGPDSLQTILDRELENGTSSFSFAVSRDGEIWIEAFNLASLN
ncbi:MAG: serine/threonine protein kinase [Paracoccaceae bacterium]